MNKPLVLETERLHRGPVGRTWSGGSVTGDLKVEISTGGFVYWVVREICRIMLWNRAGLSIATALGNMEEGLFYRGL